MLKNGEGFINMDLALRVSRRLREEYVANASTTSAACRTFLLMLDAWIVFVLYHY
jgi:hypothetical protein